MREIDVKKMTVRGSNLVYRTASCLCQRPARRVQGIHCAVAANSKSDLQINDHKKVAQRAMSTKDPDVQPFLKRLHERMDRWAHCHQSDATATSQSGPSSHQANTTPVSKSEYLRCRVGIRHATVEVQSQHHMRHMCQRTVL